MTIKEAIEHLKTYDLEEHCAMHLWTEAEVISLAEKEGTPVTAEDAQEILDDLYDDLHVRCYIQDFVRNRTTEVHFYKGGLN